MTKNNVLIIFVAAILFACGSGTSDVDSFTEKGLEKHIKELSSDAYEGRRPFTPGETKTLAYLEQEFNAIGLEPANGTSFRQEVPMVEITTTPDSTLMVTGAKNPITLSGFTDYVVWTQRTDSVIDWKNEEIVFAGFGVIAPEYNWNDYAGLDVKGKIVFVLVNDPGFGGNDTTFFKGNAMTYYGRWTYKFEEAARQGAKACFVIHNTVPAAYPFGVVQNGWKAPHLYLDPQGKKIFYSEGVGWISMPATQKLFDAAGLNFNELQTKARQPGFKGMSLGLKVSTRMTVKTKFDKSYNVIGKITGSERPDEYVIYTAHWDHLGIGKSDASGDSIYNGALDNASGTAGLLELANAFRKSPPKRTVVFLAVTAEEQGLWGSAYYAENPVYDKAKTVANINIDGLNPYGKLKDIVIVGKGQSELEDYLAEAAKSAGREVTFDPESEKGYYFRSDHFNFAKIGVPALYTHTGSNHLEKGQAYGTQLKDEYTRKYYHQPSDAYDTTRWHLDGAVDDLKLLYIVGKRLANESSWPQWKSGSEFKKVREAYKK